MRLVPVLLLVLSFPGLLLPGGIEFQACFCGGEAGGCCHQGDAPAPLVRGCACAHGRDAGQSTSTLKRTGRCDGCVRLSVPEGSPARIIAAERPVAAPPAVEAVMVLAPRGVDDAPSHRVWLDPWHAPPTQRQLPLLI